MIADKYKALLNQADIQINGDRAWDIQVHNDKLWRRLFFQGLLGFGEAYMDGWFEAERLDQFFYRIMRCLPRDHYEGYSVPNMFLKLTNTILNVQNPKRAFEVGKHYDVGNDLYQKMLGNSMAYTCGYWKNKHQLDEAQFNKFRLVAEKLMLKPGMKVLDIGCGFGSMMAFLAKEYQVEVVGVTVSKEQAKYVNQTYSHLPITAIVQDYRNIKGQFNRIYSLGMFEHVGVKNYHTYMQVCRRLLVEDGLMLLHTIGYGVSTTVTNPWIEKYIFPNSMIPSLKQITANVENLFIIEDVQNFGYDYDKTLMTWHSNFVKNWSLLSSNYDERFYRMWSYYLLSCAGAFRARTLQLFQIVMSPNGIIGRYDAPR